MSVACTDEDMPNAGGEEVGVSSGSDAGVLAADDVQGQDITDIGVADAERRGADSDIDEPAVFPVDAWGPYRVGYANFQLTYDAPNTDGAGRTIKVHLWYPTDATVGDTVLYDFLTVDDRALGYVAPRPANGEGGYPLLIHSHGHMAFGTVSYTLMDYFASHGWVAVAPDHTGNQPGIARKTPIYYQRSLDITAVLDAIEAGYPDVADRFGQQLIRTDEVAMSGHSFGVFTCWSVAGALLAPDAVAESCESGSLSNEGGCSDDDTAMLLSDLRDDRVVASIMMDGSIRRSLYGADGHTTVDIPLLTMGGSGPTGHSKGVATQYDSLSGMDVIYLDFKGACHEHFGLKECNYNDNRMPQNYGLESWDDLMDFDEAYRVIGTYALAFSRRHVLQDESLDVQSVLSGEMLVSDSVTFQRKQELN